MPNSIALFKNYVPILDEVYREASRTAVLDGAPELARAGANAGELIIPKMTMDGLADYARASGYVEAAIVVPGVIDAVFSRAAIVTGYPLLLIGDGRSPPSLLLGCLFPWRSCFRSPEGLLFRQVIPSTKCRTPSGRFAFNTSLGHGRCPLDSRQALPPCTRPMGVAP